MVRMDSGLRAVTAVLLMLFAFGADAHTGLSSSSPADGALLRRSPEVLVLEFPEPVRLVRVKLRPVDDAAIDLGDYRSNSAAASHRISLPVLAPARYLAEWVIMGGDSHKMSGSLGFTVEAN